MDYAAAKAALVNLTKALSQEFGPRGIRINAVSPGPVGTDFWLGLHGVAATVAKATGVDADTARETIVAGMGGIPTGRFTTPEESCHVDRPTRIRARSERDRRQLPHRRRAHQDHVNRPRRRDVGACWRGRSSPPRRAV